MKQQSQFAFFAHTVPYIAKVDLAEDTVHGIRNLGEF
jgi:hypothetical protein